MTIGEDRVRVKFNPDGNTAVDELKMAFAAAIDTIERMKCTRLDNEEFVRLCSLAQTDIESAAMWAVKAATSSKP